MTGSGNAGPLGYHVIWLPISQAKYKIAMRAAPPRNDVSPCAHPRSAPAAPAAPLSKMDSLKRTLPPPLIRGHATPWRKCRHSRLFLPPPPIRGHAAPRCNFQRRRYTQHSLAPAREERHPDTMTDNGYQSAIATPDPRARRTALLVQNFAHVVAAAPDLRAGRTRASKFKTVLIPALTLDPRACHASEKCPESGAFPAAAPIRGPAVPIPAYVCHGARFPRRKDLDSEEFGTNSQKSKSPARWRGSGTVDPETLMKRAGFCCPTGTRKPQKTGIIGNPPGPPSFAGASSVLRALQQRQQAP